MRLTWLLFAHSGKGNRNRLFLTAAAVALGVLMVLLFAAGLNALTTRTENANWRLNFYNNETTTKPVEGVTPLKVSLAFEGNLNKYKDTRINVVAMYATGNTSPELPDMPTPRPGEYYVSPGLAEVIKNNPDDTIGARFGTKQIGIIPDKYVTSPDSLDVVRGMSPDEAENPRASSIYRFSTQSSVSKYSGMTMILLVIGASVLFVPIIIFLMIATQLGNMQREQRYAALRLVGATKRQVTGIIAFESAMAAIAGIALGTLAFLVLCLAATEFRFDGMRFWPGDITVTPTRYIGIIAVVIFFSIVANWLAMRRVQVSPLGVVRKQLRAGKARFIRIIPLSVGVMVYVWASTFGKTWIAENATDSSGSLPILLGGIILIMFGLLIAGPYLTRVIAKRIARSTRSASTLIAVRRIETQFKPIFRSVSGVVLALFAGSFYLTAVSGIADYSQRAVQNNGYSQLLPDTALVMGNALPQGFDRGLSSQSYVKSVQPIERTNGGDAIACTELARYTKHSCSDAAQYAVINFDKAGVNKPTTVSTVDPSGQTDYLVKLLSNDSLDRLRSFVATHAPDALTAEGGTYVVSGTYAQKAVLNPMITELAGLAYVGIAVTLFIAIASLIVSTVGGFFERKRSFATLRLGGMDVGQMKRTVLIESLIPLFSTSLFSAALGCWIGYVFISSLGSSLGAALRPSYLAIVFGSLLVAALAIYSVLPMLDKITRPEENQTE